MVAWLLTWPTPAPIFTSTALSATQLDATAAGVTGAALPGAFVYSPAAGTTLAAGSEVSKAHLHADRQRWTTQLPRRGCASRSRLPRPERREGVGTSRSAKLCSV